MNMNTNKKRYCVHHNQILRKTTVANPSFLSLFLFKSHKNLNLNDIHYSMAAGFMLMAIDSKFMSSPMKTSYSI
jgi:hypothetical protein